MAARRRAWDAATERVPGLGAVRFARMSGSSIAGPDAAPWITDFLNAAYYARPPALRRVDDLRLALTIVTTRWSRLGGRRLRLTDAAAFHRAFGAARFLDGRRSPRMCLSRLQLLDGAAGLLGPWFPDAYADDDRRGWGIAFPDRAARAAHDPERRLLLAALGPLTTPSASAVEQSWSTYSPVAMPSVAAAAASLGAPERWPEFGTPLGRFTPLRSGGLEGQTFEIEVVAQPLPRTPIFTRGYVTAQRVLERGPELDATVAALNAALEATGSEPVVPAGATPHLLVELTTHAGHFLGPGASRVTLYEHEGRAYLRDAGSWDPLPWYLDQPYRLAGHAAQVAFWGNEQPELSMLAQVGLWAAARAG